MKGRESRKSEISAILDLVQNLFDSSWVLLSDAARDPNLAWPGVYFLAYSSKNLSGGKPKSKDVVYVGMTNSAGGVRSRLQQFLAGLEINYLHSGAMRFYRDHAGGRPFSELKTRKKFFCAVHCVKCVSRKRESTPSDIRMMGHVACMEYYAIARVYAEFGEWPFLNRR